MSMTNTKKITLKPKIKANNKPAKKPVSQDLKKTKKDLAKESFDNLYSEKKESEMDKFDQKPKRGAKRKLVITLMILVILVLATLIGYLLVGSNQNTDEEAAIATSLEIEKIVTSGDEIVLIYNFQTSEKVGVTDTELLFTYPEGFYYSSASLVPVNSDGTVFDLGDIAKNDSGLLEVKGIIIGQINDTLEFKSELVYQPDNFSSSFVEKDNSTVLISDTNIEVSITMPDKATTGQKIEYKAIIKNTSDNILENVRVEITAPDDFETTATNKDVFGLNYHWEFDEIAKSEEQEVILKGDVIGGANSLEEFEIRVGIVNDNKFILQQQEKSTLLIVEPKIGFDFSIESMTEDFVVSLEAELDYVINIKNNSDLALEDVVLELDLSQTSRSGTVDVLDLDNIDSSDDLEFIENKLTITKEEVADLAFLTPSSEITIEFSLPILADLSISDVDVKELQVKSELSVESFEVDGLDSETGIEISSQDITFKINTDLKIDAIGRMYDDELNKVGSGIHPPKVGEKTVYQVDLSATNTTNDLKNSVITMVLPEYVKWEDITDTETASQYSYDSTNNIVRWTIGNIKAHSGELLSNPTSWFKVSLTPVSADVGKVLGIVESINMSALDNFTKEQITATDKAVTTMLLEDDLVAGNGKVKAAN